MKLLYPWVHRRSLTSKTTKQKQLLNSNLGGLSESRMLSEGDKGPKTVQPKV